jgi:hypothetical protein
LYDLPVIFLWFVFLLIIADVDHSSIDAPIKARACQPQSQRIGRP